MIAPETPSNFGAQNEKAKSNKAKLVARIARLVRQTGLDYAGWRYVAKRVRQVCELRPAKKGRRLPNVLNSVSSAASMLSWTEPKMFSTP